MSVKHKNIIEDPESLLCEVAKILQELKIPYVITGGFAVAIWGRPRFTADIDIIVELLDKNILSLAKRLLLLDEDSYLDITAIKNALVNRGEFNFIHANTGMKVDFWIRNSEFDRLKIKRAVCKQIKHRKINFVSPEDLILSKLLWYKKNKSERELEDIKSILKFSKIDLKYIKKFSQKHSTENIFKKIKS
ncbi:nucleotidyltransferase [Patescibacteria group bacterium]|nr:nucleotidyltransferase [Patescibacteria group bacterium]